MPMMPIDVQTDGALACVNGDFTPLLNGANLSEAKFLLQQLLTYSIDRGVAARKVEADLKNCQQRLKEVEDAARIQEGLLTLVEQPDDDTATVIMESSTMSIDRPLSSVGERKVRQRNTSSAHLLFPHRLTTSTSSLQSFDDSAVQSQSVSSQDGTASVDSGSPKSARSSVFTRLSSMRRTYSGGVMSPSANGSPKRRVSGTALQRSSSVRGGFVSTSNAINVESKLVTRIFTIKAHGKSLLSTQLSNGMLLTGSKDRSARIFDLEKQCEVAQLEHHINAVTTARFVPDSNLVLTTSSYMAHIWDLRSSQCVTTLRSSGIVDHAEFNYAQPRVNLIPPSESRIAAACLDPSGCLLFTSFERDIRIWDLRRLSENVTARCVNATKTASSEITCLSTSMLSNQSVRLFSGSKDHAVKVFDVPFDIVSGRDFEPVGESLLSHDVISAVVPYRDSFFVASHDKSVAKYNVRDMERDHVSTSHALPVIALNLFRSPITNEDLLVSLDKKVMCFWDISGYKHQFLSKMSVNTEAMCLGTEPSPDYPVSLCTGHSNGDVELYRLKSE
uniref:WD_REPEATS_REGION domain-containing protein n=1 Tax=Steinernema glaseri TaxID=37863 RepID=A0A1I8A7H5_9BILA